MSSTALQVSRRDNMVRTARQLAAAGNQSRASVQMEQAAIGAAPKVAAARLAQAGLWVMKTAPERAIDLMTRSIAASRTEAPPEAWETLAHLLQRLGRTAKARELGLEALSVLPPSRTTLRIARLILDTGEVDRALEAARAAFEALGRPLEEAHAVLPIALQAADWPLADQVIAQLGAAYREGRYAEVQETPRTHLLWCGDEATNVEMVKRYAARFVPRPKGPIPVVQARPKAADEPLRVGYLSSDYREHPTSYLINGLFRHHDRTRFRLYSYCCSWDDKSATRREVLSHFHVNRQITELDDAAAAQLIRDDGIDILVDLNGQTRLNRLGVLAHRPAPVQISYLGFPGTTGCDFVDYVVADEYVLPPALNGLYPEKIIRIEGSYQLNDYAARGPLPPVTRAQFGLPEGVPLVGIFNKTNKVTSEVWAAWMRIAAQVPDVLLVMVDPGAVARRHFARACVAAGVDPRRVVAVPRVPQALHLARLQVCDLMLDPWPYGGHTTTADAIHAGVPVLAREGTNFASRVSGSLLRASGLGALVQPDTDAYVRLGATLLREPAKLARIRAFMAEHRARLPLFASAAKTRQLEAAYRAAYDRTAKGLEPRHISVRK